MKLCKPTELGSSSNGEKDSTYIEKHFTKCLCKKYKYKKHKVTITCRETQEKHTYMTLLVRLNAAIGNEHCT